MLIYYLYYYLMNEHLSPQEFQILGHQIINRLSRFLETIENKPITPAENPEEVQQVLKSGDLPLEGSPPEKLIISTIENLINHSLFNGHPRFMGYITSAALPIGALADLIASTLNQNTGAWQLSPLASEIERQTIKWIAEFIGYDKGCGGILMSGGNMANFVGLLTARKSKGNPDIQKTGLNSVSQRMLMYASEDPKSCGSLWFRYRCYPLDQHK